MSRKPSTVSYLTLGFLLAKLKNSDLNHFTSLRFDINILIDAADFYHLRTSANAGTDHNQNSHPPTGERLLPHARIEHT